MGWLNEAYSRTNRVDRLLALTLFIIALYVMFGHITFESLWEDEGSTYHYGYVMNPVISFFVSDPGAPFGFYTLERFMILIFGNSELAIRFFPALFASMCIPGLYLLSRRMDVHQIPSLMVAIVLMCTIPFVTHANYARPYPLATFFVILLVYLALDLYESYDDGHWKRFIVVGAVSMYFFYIMFMPVGAVLLWFWLRLTVKKDEGGRRHIVWSEGAPIIRQGKRFMLYSAPALVEFFIATFIFSTLSNVEATTGVQFFPVILDYLFSDSNLLITLALVLLGLGSLSMCRDGRDRMVVFVFYLIVMMLFLLSFKRLFTRYVLFIFPMMLLIIANSTRLPKLSLNVVSCLGVVSMVIIAGPILPTMFEEPDEPDYRGAYSYVSENAVEGDILIVMPDREGVVYASMFYHDADVDGAVEFTAALDGEELRSIIANRSSGTSYVLLRPSWTSDTTMYETLTPEKVVWASEKVVVYRV